MRRALATLVLALTPVAVGVAVAGDVMKTKPDACSVLTASAVKPVLGPTAMQHREPFTFPDPTKYQPNPRRLVDALQTGCTWVDFRRGTYVNVEVVERNPDYAGTRPFNPAEANWLDALAYYAGVVNLKHSYVQIKNDYLAKRSKAPWFTGDKIAVIGDRATIGRRIAALTFQPTDDGLVLLHVIGGGRNALDVLIAVTRRLLSG